MSVTEYGIRKGTDGDVLDAPSGSSGRRKLGESLLVKVLVVEIGTDIVSSLGISDENFLEI